MRPVAENAGRESVPQDQRANDLNEKMVHTARMLNED
jgi:hypothetical protein